MRVKSLFIYPVKGLQGIEVSSAVAEARGFRFDRRRMVVDEDGLFLSQRRCPKMASVQVSLGSNGLTLSCSSESLFLDDHLIGPEITATVWKSELPTPTVSQEADSWLSDILGQKVRLVQMTASVRRQISLNHSEPGEWVSFADAYPVLVTSQSSLDDLNQRLKSPVPMNRFRPSLVVEGAEPWAEDGWQTLSVGGVQLRFTTPCGRCQVTTIDQATGNSCGDEPLRTLATFRKAGSAVNFGVNAVPVSLGVIDRGAECRLS